MNTILKKYNQLEANNSHTAAAKLLVDNFGTEEEKTTMNGIVERHKKNQFISSEDYRLRYEISQKYYIKIINS